MKRTFFYRILLWSTIAILAPTITFAQAKLETSVQSTAGGTAQSSSYSLVATVGQSTPPAQASSTQFVLSGGFIYTLGNAPPRVANTIANQTLTSLGAVFTRDLNASPVIFTDPDGDALTYIASSSNTNIAIANVSGSTLTVTAVAEGNATITVTADDQNGNTISTTFSVTVSIMVNRPPVVANVIANQLIQLSGPAFTRDLNAAPAVFSDPDNDPLSYTASSIASAVATAEISGSTLTVKPVTVGSVTITVTANDNRGGMVSTTFTANVEQANRPPVVTSAISNQRLPMVGATFMRDLSTVFADPDGDVLAFTASSSASNIATANVPIGSSMLTVTGVAGGSAMIEVAATDGKSQPAADTFMVTVNLPPNLSHAAPSMHPSGQVIPIIAGVTDDGGIASVQLQYRRGGGASFSSAPMSFTSGTNYQGTIPATEVTSRGVEYFIVATDADNVQARKPDTPGSYYSIQIQVTGETKPAAQPSGSAATAYRLISVPLQLDNPSANAVLEDDLGTYDDTKWRLYGLNPTAAQDQNNKTPYVELRTGGDLSPGKSLFLIVRDPGKFITIGAAKSVRTDQEFQITLQRGHNFVGTPFNFNIPVSKLRLQSSGAVALRTFNGSFVPANEMQPWEGYYLANLNQSADILFVNPNLSSSALLQAESKINAGGWRVRIQASCAEARDDYNFAGVESASHDGYDDNDLAEPPPIGDFVSAYFPHPEWQKALSRFSNDIRSAAGSNHQWQFRVSTSIPNAVVTLRFNELEGIDPALGVWLLDKELNYKQNLRDNAVYRYQPRDLDRAKAFTLIVGEEDFVAGQTAGVEGVPEDFVLEQNFPNPFPASGIFDNPGTAIRFGLPEKNVVTIKIFDLSGHEVAMLLEKEELPAGRHQRVWDGRDAQGRAVANGIYFYRIVAGKFSKTMKMTVVR